MILSLTDREYFCSLQSNGQNEWCIQDQEFRALSGHFGHFGAISTLGSEQTHETGIVVDFSGAYVS